MNKITELFGIKYPIIQGGMVWVSGWKLASSVSNTGGLGLIGAGSMYPEILREHIQKCKKATTKPFGVNVPLKYPNADEIIDIIIEEGVKIVFTAAGNPKLYTSKLQSNGIKVAHVVSSVKFALKAQDAGVDAIVCEGFEAGGHNGIEETTTFVLVPSVKKAINVPLIAAGGIGSGKTILAAMTLGADGVQIGSRFVTAKESSAHPNFKQRIIDTKEGGTKLTMKEIGAVRLIKNKFFEDIQQLYKNNYSLEKLKELNGHARAKLGMFNGDLEEGKLEIGQISASITKLESAKEIIDELIKEYNDLIDQQKCIKFAT